MEGRKIFVVFRNGEYYGYENECPHQFVPLDWDNDEFLDSSGELILCASHGAQFIIESGRCVAGPCVGARLQTVPLKVIDSQLYLVGE